MSISIYFCPTNHATRDANQIALYNKLTMHAYGAKDAIYESLASTKYKRCVKDNNFFIVNHNNPFKTVVIKPLKEVYTYAYNNLSLNAINLMVNCCFRQVIEHEN